jgi:hypothetical protein
LTPSEVHALHRSAPLTAAEAISHGTQPGERLAQPR